MWDATVLAHATVVPFAFMLKFVKTNLVTGGKWKQSGQAKGNDGIYGSEFVNLMLVQYGEAILAVGESEKGEWSF